MTRIDPALPRARTPRRIAVAIALFLALITAASCGRVEGARLVGTWSVDMGDGATTDEVRGKSILPELTFGSDGTCTAELLRGDDARSAKVDRSGRRWKLVLDRGDRWVVRFTSPKSQHEWLVTCIFADDDHIELVEGEGVAGMKYARVR